jgi:hypothetical protein
VRDGLAIRRAQCAKRVSRKGDSGDPARGGSRVGVGGGQAEPDQRTDDLQLAQATFGG